MTLPQLSALTEYWSEHPPMHITVEAIARGLGGKVVESKRATHEPSDGISNEVGESDMDMLMSVFGAPQIVHNKSS